jgi:hypothetical protein
MQNKRKLQQNDMGLRLFNNYKKQWLALGLGFWGGFAGILVDIDHWFNTTGFKGWGMDGRPLHVPLAILACCVGVYSYSRLRRLAFRVVLKWVLIVLAIVVVLAGIEILWIRFMWNV